MHSSRGTIFLAPFLFLFFSSSSWSCVSTREEMPMQLSRAELARVAGYGEERLSSVLVMGTLLCEACLDPGSELRTTHVPGAKVAVACKVEGRRRKINWIRGTTDEFGEFIVDLPSHLHAIPRLDEACIVKVLRVPKNSFCQHILGVKPKSLKLSSLGNSIRVYTAGNIRLSHHTKVAGKCFRERI